MRFQHALPSSILDPPSSPPFLPLSLVPIPGMMTRRERKVKKMLLKELHRLGRGDTLSGLSYAEKQHLEKTLNVDFIDREVEKMNRNRPRLRGLMKGAALIGGGWVVVSVVLLVMGNPFDFMINAVIPLTLLGSAVNLWYADHLLQRRTFIYEALRELSDADERDIPLSRALQQADALIEQIVEREMEIEERHTLRTKAYTP